MSNHPRVTHWRNRALDAESRIAELEAELAQTEAYIAGVDCANEKLRAELEDARKIAKSYEMSWQSCLNEECSANERHCTCVPPLRLAAESLRAQRAKLVEFMLENYSCPSAAGFEGPQTFSDCGKCEYCKLVAELEGGE